jgi:hypothetical protein
MPDLKKLSQQAQRRARIERRIAVGMASGLASDRALARYCGIHVTSLRRIRNEMRIARGLR